MSLRTVQRALVATLVVGVLTIGLAQAITFNVLWERETGSQLFWNDDGQVVLLVGLRTDGWSGSSIAYLWEYLIARLGEPNVTEELAESVQVYRWDDAGFSQQRLSNTQMSSYRLHEGSLYGPSGDGFSRLTHQGFERVPRGEAQAIVGKSVTPPFSDVDGWSGRSDLLAIRPGATKEHSVRFRNQELLVVAEKSATGLEKSIDVILGGERRRVFEISEARQSVDLQKYHAARQ
jgi:hypothetical protein